MDDNKKSVSLVSTSTTKRYGDMSLCEREAIKTMLQAGIWRLGADDVPLGKWPDGCLKTAFVTSLTMSWQYEPYGSCPILGQRWRHQLDFAKDCAMAFYDEDVATDPSIESVTLGELRRRFCHRHAIPDEVERKCRFTEETVPMPFVERDGLMPRDDGRVA